MNNENIKTNATVSENVENDLLTEKTNYGTINSADLISGKAELVLIQPFDDGNSGISVACVGGDSDSSNTGSDNNYDCCDDSGSSSGSGSSGGSYHDCDCCEGDNSDCECSNNTASAISIEVNRLKHGEVFCPEQVNRYYISISKEGKYYFRTTRNVSTKIKLENIDNNKIGNAAKVGNNNDALVATLSPGTYYFNVSGTTTGTYGIIVSDSDVREVRVDTSNAASSELDENGMLQIVDIPSSAGIVTGRFASHQKITLIHISADKPDWSYVSGEVEFNGGVVRRYGWCKNKFLRQIEYHLIPYLQSNMAICVNGKSNQQLTSDTELILQKKSYRNMQKWEISNFENYATLFTKHGKGFGLCKKNDSNEAIVSLESSEKDHKLTFISASSDCPLYRIILGNTGLYLTVIDNAVDSENPYKIEWAHQDHFNTDSQLWLIEEQPSIFHNGLDTRTVMSNETIKKISAANEEFVIRYYSHADNVDKILTSEEKERLKENNLKIVCVYQDNATEEKSFIENQGTADANRALELAKQLGQPEDSAIYFTVDTDNIDKETIKSYFDKIKVVFDSSDKKYKIGIYGNGILCDYIKQTCKIADFSWLCSGSRRNGYVAYDDTSKYDIKQSDVVYYNATQFDDNVAVGEDYGQW